jgi:hypothetical protein
MRATRRTPYKRKQGDPVHGPNPCVAPIARGPFYAVKVLPGSFGTFAGRKTNSNGKQAMVRVPRATH